MYSELSKSWKIHKERHFRIVNGFHYYLKKYIFFLGNLKMQQNIKIKVLNIEIPYPQTYIFNILVK